MQILNTNIKHQVNSKNIVIVLGIVLYLITRQGILNPYVVNNDASLHLIWINDWSHYHSNDETIEFSKTIQPIGFSILLSTLKQFLSPNYIVILVDLVKCLVLLFLTMLLALKWYPNKLIRYLFFSALFLITINLGNILTPRSLASVFILSAIFFETNSSSKKNQIFKSINILLSSVFYPPAFLILSLYYGLINLKFPLLKSAQAFFKNYWLVLICILMGIGINFLRSNAIYDNPLVGELIDKDFIMTDSHAGPDGRVKLKKFWEDPIKSFVLSIPRHFLPKQLYSLATIPFLILIIIYSFFNFFDRIDFRLKTNALILSGFILYGAAVLFPLKFFIPDRYIHYSFGIGLFIALSQIYNSKKNKPKSLKLILVVFFISTIINGLQYSENDYSDYKTVYTKCEEIIPPKSMIMSNDFHLTDMIPYLSNRSAFVNHESLHAIYFKNYRERQDHKMMVWNEFFATKNTTRLLQLIEENEIDHLLLKAPYFRIVNDDVPTPHKIDSIFGETALQELLKTRNSSQFEIGKDSFRIYQLE